MFIGSLAREFNASDDEVNDFKLIIDEACKLCIKEGLGDSILVEVRVDNEFVKQLVGPFGLNFKKQIHENESAWGISILQALTNKLNFSNKEDQIFLELTKQLPPLPYPRT